jgi:hypothetical protein
MTRLLLALVAFFAVVVGGPFLLLALAFWAADGSWDFEGNGNLRYWLFVKGSRLERLGAVEPTGPLRYSVSLQEGTFPGWSVAQYDSRALPEAILDAYAEHCRAMALKITERTLPVADRAPNAVAGRLICQIEPYLDVELFAERAGQASTTEVGIKVWGDK